MLKISALYVLPIKLVFPEDEDSMYGTILMSVVARQLLFDSWTEEACGPTAKTSIR